MNDKKALTSYVTKITDKQVDILFTILDNKGFNIEHPPYTF